MGREQSDDPYKNLRQHSISDQQINTINLSDAVMNHISASQSDAKARSYNLAKPFPIYVTILFIVLLTSASVYAASELIQIRDRAGDVKIKSIVLESESKIVPYTLQNDPPLPTYRDRVLELVKPGQMLAYYVRNDSSPLTIQYLHNTNTNTSYNDFNVLLARTSAPVIKEPVNLPDGFTFKYGSVMPLIPNEHDASLSEEHARLLALFKQRAAAEPDQNLFIEEVNWTKANISELEYTKNNMSIRIQAMKNMIGMEVALSAEYTQETVDINGIETIFASGSIHGFQSYQAIWYDEAQKTHYQVTASDNVDLTEEQFKLVVKGLI
ncbi:hypothetical protein BK120_17050 [Paenibacillus sp. FSL A5-0031]|uniref:hypothetical protein n=1 Tax=Paenibacillus sp. FSL A5-0031 TaxID=1920420 RepID=UPI00096E9BE2|nr:hypothetical protein [Paenibacillus sp. FSL A5-0031]OME81365.1 hypothetical protein BK120_17050 [Paenibacillus sp. FSL A5-0031]